MPPLVTFVIPTVGRDTLARALSSLMSQSSDEWEAVVIYDGDLREASFTVPDDERLWLLEAERGSAGLTRNVGLDWFYSNGESRWVAFLDDDDVLMPDYVKHLNEHAADYPWAEVIVFRMDHPNIGIVPSNEGHLSWGRVGISFALRSDLIDDYRFNREDRVTNNNEDWDLIHRLMQDEKKIFISPHVDYIVRAHNV
jgi:glycosyltransferase involved in cell wall biosynthesis